MASTSQAGKTILFIAGLCLVAAAVIGNHWILGAIFSLDGSLGARSKLLIWAFQIACLTLGVCLIRAARTADDPWAWVREKYAFVSIQVFNIFVLLVLINLFAWWRLQATDTPRPQVDLYHDPIHLFFQDPEFLQGIYPGRSSEDIWELINPPSSRANPVIEYMAGPHRSKHYNIGFEGMRYNSHITEENAPSIIDGATWVFGGSTLFGAGISDDETIVHFLNELDPENSYLNFGFPSYHQNLEIQKLLLLLKKGYRPRRVILLDGWNDLVALRSSNFHPAETPAKNQHAYGSVTSIEALLDPPTNVALRKVPVMKWLYQFAEGIEQEGTGSPLDSHGYDDIYSSESPYHTDPMRHYRRVNEAQYDYEELNSRAEFYQEKLLLYYSSNMKFLADLEKGFGFEAFVFLQPLGSVSESNPFLKKPETLKSHPYYQYCAAMLAAAQDAIKNDRLENFYDISNADDSLKSAYVDPGHYNPQLCRVIARAILATLQEEKQRTGAQ